MKELLGVFPLKNLQTGAYEDAELYMHIDSKNVDDFENLWKPILNDKLSNLTAGETSTSINAQDHHWEWRKKMNDRDGRIDYESFSVECDGITQGLMFVSTIAFAKEPSQKGEFLIYIDLISSAPWNRVGFSDNRKYKGTGPLLLGTAISYSIDQGFNGKIGLHSLPQSESWYKDECGMTDLGPDAYNPQNLNYFEMTEKQANTFINT